MPCVSHIYWAVTSDIPAVVGRQDEYLVNMQHTVIPSWYNRNGYVQSMATLIEKELAKFEKPDEVGLELSFSCIHSFRFLLLSQVGRHL